MCSFEGTRKRREYSSLAQSVEHAAVNRSVVGSSPTGGAWKEKNLIIKYGSVVKRLRHRPFTAVTRVRFPSESFSNTLIDLSWYSSNLIYEGVL